MENRNPRSLSLGMILLAGFLSAACGPATLSAIQTALAETATAENLDFSGTAEADWAEQSRAEVAEGCGGSVPTTGYDLVIGNLVWFDTNGNSLQDPGEPGVSGIPVELWVNDSPYLIGSTVTDSEGHYYFCLKDFPSPVGVPSPFNYYRLHFIAPPGFTWGEYQIGDDPNIDNDVKTDGTRFGWTYHIDASADYSHTDAGLMKPNDAAAKTAEAALQELKYGVYVTGDVNCRSGPGAEYSVIDTLDPHNNNHAQVVAVLPGSEYVVVRLDNGAICWLWLQYVTPNSLNDYTTEGLPIATQPPTPTPGPTQTPKPTKTPSPTPTPSVTPSPTITQEIK